MAQPDNQCTLTPSPDRVVELVANLDDITGERLGEAIDRLIAAGALDAWATPITMKKGRPAAMLSALVQVGERDRFTRLMLEVTGSFGVRHREWGRVVLDRDWYERATRLGGVTLKAGSWDGQAITVKPEFDSVLALAESAGVSTAEAHQAASAAADTLLAELRGKGGGS